MTDRPSVTLTDKQRALLDYFVADWRDAREHNMDGEGCVLPEYEATERLYRELLAGDMTIVEVAEMKEALSYSLDMLRVASGSDHKKITEFYVLIGICYDALEVNNE